jgi:putative ABC transport system substrate-binding protein
MDRRNAVRYLALICGAALTARATHAQQARNFKVAILTTAGGRGDTPFYAAMERRFRELGYVDGKNLTLIWQSAAGRLDKIPDIAAELGKARPDVIIAPGSETVLRSIRLAAGSTPIVMIAIDYDPVETNFVTSLARPGGNITGLFLRQVESAAKRLELLKEALPGASRVAVLWDSFTRDQLNFIESAAKKLNLVLLPYQMQGNPYDFEGPLKDAKAQRAEAVLALTSGPFFLVREKMFAAAHAQRLPVIANPNYAEAGALIAFGASFSHIYIRAAEYVDRILKGAKPGDLPVDQPDRYDLIVNLKTARALGLKIPQSVLLRANRVIE